MSGSRVYQLSVFCGGIEAKLDPAHELVILGHRIDWGDLTEELAPFYSLIGRKAKPSRLMIGLHMLKHRFKLSDKVLVEQLRENIYWRWFCGLQDDLPAWSKEKPLHPSTLTKFRRRMGIAGMTVIEKVIDGQLLKEKRIDRRVQVVDTTAMPKNIAYPNNTNLLAKGIERVKQAVVKLGKLGLSVAVRGYQRLVRKEILKVNKLGRGRQERINNATTKLIGYARKVGKAAETSLQAIKKGASTEVKKAIEASKRHLEEELDKLRCVVSQSERRVAGEHVPANEKILSMHEPNVTVIAKGKRGKRYEFGAKVSLSMDRNGYIVGHQEYHENIADVNSLEAAVEDWARRFGEYPEELAGDRGYHTSNPPDALGRIKRIAIPTRGKKKHPDHKKSYFRRLQRLRNTIEPIIGHLKTDHKMNKCRYKGKDGDSQNVAWAAITWNLRKWFKELEAEMQSAA